MIIKQILRRAAPALLAIAVFVPLTQPLSVPASARATQTQLDNLRKDAADLDKQKKDLKNDMKKVQADKTEALGKKNYIEQQMNLVQGQIDNYDQQISVYNSLIEEKNTEIAANEEKEDQQYQLFCQRVRCMEEDGQKSYWSILFASASFTELLDNFMMVEEIMAYDNAVMDSLIATREGLETKKGELETLKSGQETARAEQVAAKSELSTQEAEVDGLISEIKADETKLKNREAELKKAANEVDAELRRVEQELAPQISNVPSESGFLWPLSGYNTLSSLYGGRRHPVTGKPNNHTGIDIPAPKGTPILAAKSGVVTTSKYNRSYGNYVVVSHSDGTSTLYAHMSKRKASVGDTVKQGQTIGLVGTTGSSTGNHLHFEIRVNGNRTDPVNYFKDKVLYARSNGKTVLLKH